MFEPYGKAAWPHAIETPWARHAHGPVPWHGPFALWAETLGGRENRPNARLAARLVSCTVALACFMLTVTQLTDGEGHVRSPVLSARGRAFRVL